VSQKYVLKICERVLA